MLLDLTKVPTLVRHDYIQIHIHHIMNSEVPSVIERLPKKKTLDHERRLTFFSKIWVNNVMTCRHFLNTALSGKVTWTVPSRLFDTIDYNKVHVHF
jgi:hypothetical protein